MAAEKVRVQRCQHAQVAIFGDAGYSFNTFRICDTLSKHIKISEGEMRKLVCGLERDLRLLEYGLAPLGLTYSDRRDFCL